ncbi:MAG: 50S ribosome-binding GTPase [Sedimentisphaerales bacterium]|nr:50S ribosome-binding GTPase [Sedimentisphaerales bacterium]
MYNINDTIVALSSGASPSLSKIIRISGPKVFEVLKTVAPCVKTKKRQIVPARVNITEDFAVRMYIYLFCSPESYTGDDLVEVHLSACEDVVKDILAKLFSFGCRLAEPGEFTYRAYVNGKMDLSQAEAVAQLIQSSNQYQLCAAQKLLGGSLEKKVCQIHQEILGLLSLTEAALDFSTEEIDTEEEKGAETAKKICDSLNELLTGSITFEQIVDAPSAIIIGSANAGKSSLANALIGTQRSITSEHNGTTRDVLEHWLKLDKCDCVLFDCAGLTAAPADIISVLANAATAKAIKDAAVIIFCADAAKQDYSSDLEVLKGLDKKPSIYTATKCDLLNAEESAQKLNTLKGTFGCDFIVSSSKSLLGVEELKALIQQNIINQTSDTTEAADKTALTERHRTVIAGTIENVQLAGEEFIKNSQETAAMFLRSALQNLESFEAEHIDEAILERIFSHFCIGK